ncbi:hypothetical protein JQT95_19245 [Sulfitobacter mediterraneus]|nr:hypothetical protein [Sulfitobacter mediterraneus]
MFQIGAAGAGESERMFIFLETIVCSKIPLSACQTLNPETARTIYRANFAVWQQKFCGTTNLNAAKQLLETAPDAMEYADACREILKIGRP